MVSFYSPQPKRSPKRLPRRRPIKAIPSGLEDKGIVGNWLMYYLKGGDHLHDFSPENNHGTINGAKWVSTRRGWALKLDGESDYVQVSDDPSLDITEEITMSAWIKLGGSTGAVQSALRKENAYIVGWIPDTYDEIRTYISIGGSWYNAGWAVDLSQFVGEWHHITGTFDGSTIRLYWDSEEKVTTDVSGTIDTNANDLFLGSNSGTGEYFNGSISEVRIYDRVT